ncbi:hypothetical protein FACS1894151_07560 [Spirochaetia bacterium]|nr:hypothetical protein FACS1894151_07560 [Spirochaetia bacterium]
MLEEPVKNIMLYLDSKARERFSGGVKMGFEDGRPASFAESTHPDLDIPEVQYDFNLAETLEKACRGKFYGTLFFVYREGEITHFYYNRTWQGRVLEGMLVDLDSPKPKPKTRLTVVVNR